MSFPRYPAYKPSGVEWLGEVPEHWQVKPLKRVADIQTGLAKGKEVEPEGSVEVPFLRVANVQDGFLDLENVHTITISESSLNRYLLRPGDVLMNEGGDFDKLGRGCIWDGTINPCIHQNHVFAVRPHSIRPAWLNVYTSSIQANSYFISRSKQSTNLASISSSNLMDLLVPIAPVSETEEILAFLDRETAKIDALIAEQQRLIELLEEKRQAVISHAVIKGLNPNAPMKDSGVKWLGEVPEHWEVKKLRYVCKIQTGSRDTEEALDDGEYPFFVRSQTIEKIDSYSYDCEAVLTAGDGAGVGKVFHYHTGPFDFHQRVYMLNEFNKIHGKLIYHFLKTNFFKVALQGGAKSTVDSLRRPMFTGFPVCIPPKDEQEPLLAFIEAEEKRVGKLIATSEHAVSLLQERRSALISAAVTGQIDVRGLAPEADAA